MLLRSYRTSRFANLPDIVVGYRETGLYARKIFSSRYLFSHSLLRQFRREGRPDRLVRALAGQIARDRSGHGCGLDEPQLQITAASSATNHERRTPRVDCCLGGSKVNWGLPIVEQE